MKDSGIEWIRKIPNSWIVNRVKFYCEINSGVAIDKNDYMDNGYPIYGAGGPIGSAAIFNLTGEHILTGRVGTIGKTFYVSQPIWATDNTLVVSQTNPNIALRYLCYVLSVCDYEREISKTAQPLMTATKLGNLYIPIPTLETQKEIANYLDRQCDQIAQIHNGIQLEIETLEEYKKSVIYEYVTGKKRL